MRARMLPRGARAIEFKFQTEPNKILRFIAIIDHARVSEVLFDVSYTQPFTSYTQQFTSYDERDRAGRFYFRPRRNSAAPSVASKPVRPLPARQPPSAIEQRRQSPETSGDI